MKRKIYSVVLSVVIACGILLSGCDGLSGGYVKISSLDDLYAMASNKSYELTCDIDLNGGEWYPLAVKNFNGNGYTIKNGYIIQTTENYACGFFTEAESLENVIFDSMQSNVTFSNNKNGKYYASYNAGGIVVGEAKKISNIKIKNSQAFFTTSLDNDSHTVNCGIIAGCVGKINNSSVENCELKCSKIDSELYVGGIVGNVYSSEEEKVIDNEILDSNIYADGALLNCGGIVGYLNGGSGKISDCVVRNNLFKLQASSKNTSRAGGIVGYLKEKNNIEKCVSGNNEIMLNCKAGYNIGGIIGKSEGMISNCLSDSNNLNGTTESTSSKQFAGVGGLCGSTSATISKSVAQYNKVSGTNSVVSSSMFSAGFVARTSATITNCAVYNNSVTGGNRDVFTDKADDLLFNCYTAEKGESMSNINSLPVLSPNEWNNIITILSLDPQWYIEGGNLYLG